MRRTRSLAGRFRLAALYAALAALLILARPVPALLAAGGVLVATGEAIRIWAAGHLVKSSRLVTWGPYARVRHPLYLGRLLILTGLLLAAWVGPVPSLALLVVSWAGFFGYYLPRKERIEGARLLERHGAAFASYRSAVPALLPARRPYPGSAGAWSRGRMAASGEPWLALALVLVLGLLVSKTALP
jgi:protein-S-isoprenylcysteine O-methyltransferase Ste14